jgi:hypothetical protein
MSQSEKDYSLLMDTVVKTYSKQQKYNTKEVNNQDFNLSATHLTREALPYPLKIWLIHHSYITVSLSLLLLIIVINYVWIMYLPH